MREVLAYNPATGCPSQYDWLSFTIRPVVHRHTTGRLSSYDRLSVDIRTVVHRHMTGCLSQYERLSICPSPHSIGVLFPQTILFIMSSAIGTHALAPHLLAAIAAHIISADVVEINPKQDGYVNCRYDVAYIDDGGPRNDQI